ncbi:apolipoprotein N-acyltransferase [Stigmatella sp. ncwal1]|uniref:Apolipoprotein N-acyltransferase n=1 Tax=Stigmatella ashevillensis TaxID=2995309 RepID=A0ABT5DLU8_9BACT|nr:apolipoprotein N-acyltransferase [Stigmatella ashevillena]MDC0714645.1 apolipoprotein N-acyltransferase [Stigmatella ashevillena]
MLVFPVNVLGLVAGFACYFHALAQSPRPRDGLQRGGVFGLTLAVSSLYWLTDVLSVVRWEERVAGAAVVGGFLLLIALPYGLWGSVASGLSRSAVAPWLWLLHAPGVLGVQALIHDAWLGFPWLHQGYWLAFGPLGSWLGVLGAQGAGLLLLFLASGVGLWNQHARARPLALAAAGALSLGLFIPTRFSSPGEERLIPITTVALTPPEVSDSARDDLTLLSQYVAATPRTGTDWTVWPESVIRDGGTMLAPLREVLGPQGGPIFTGALLAAPTGRYNALVELRGGQPLYYKQKLVPFSEYIPGELLRWLFQRLGLDTLKTDVRTWEEPQPPLEVDGVTVSPLLCYEVAFTGLISPGEHPQVLLNAGNEGWFRSALLHRMTLAMAVARAQEYGLPLVRSVTGGYSGSFDPTTGTWQEAGETQGSATLHRARILARPSATPYSQWRRLLP